MKKYKLFLVLLFLLTEISPALKAQESFTIKAKVSGLTSKEVYLTRFNRQNQSLVDSVAVDGEGRFVFVIPREGKKGIRINPATGLFNVVLGQTAEEKFFNKPPQSFYFILAGNNVTMSTSFSNPIDSMKVEVGKENQVYYEYVKIKKRYNKKLDLLANMVDLYPDDCKPDDGLKGTGQDCFYEQIKNQYNQLQNTLLAYSNGLIEKYNGTLLAEIIESEQFPFLDASLTKDERLKILKEKYFSPADFQDTTLLYSDVLTEKILSFIALYRNTQYTNDEQIVEFTKATNQLLSIAKTGDTKVYQFVLDYLLEGFNQIKQDAMLVYITDNYLTENSCGIEDEKLKEILQKSADYKRTELGVIAPEIIFNGSISNQKDLNSESQPANNLQSGTIGKLSDIHSEYTLVLFWASWCPHCSKMLPQLKKVYEEYKNKGLEIVAVSLDDNKLQWANAIADGHYDWINYSEFKKWESPTARLYNVNGTPTMFLLDKDKKIIAKPDTIDQLLNSLVFK